MKKLKTSSDHQIIALYTENRVAEFNGDVRILSKSSKLHFLHMHSENMAINAGKCSLITKISTSYTTSGLSNPEEGMEVLNL